MGYLVSVREKTFQQPLAEMTALSAVHPVSLRTFTQTTGLTTDQGLQVMWATEQWVAARANINEKHDDRNSRASISFSQEYS